MIATKRSVVAGLMACLSTGCGPATEPVSRPEWLTRFAFPLDVDFFPEDGLYYEFEFGDEGEAYWRRHEYCPRPANTQETSLSWTVGDGERVEVEADAEAQGGLEFPYRDVLIEPWDCDEILFQVTRVKDGSPWSFRASTVGKRCVDEDSCALSYCEEPMWDLATMCPVR